MNFLVTRKAVMADIPEIVGIHIKSFKGFFLTFLGADFLSILYQSYIGDQRNGILWVVVHQERIVGFVAGVIQQKGYYKKLIKEKVFAFAFASIKAIISEPRTLPRLIRALKRPNEAEESATEACLMSIAVLPEWQGYGIGKRLIEVFSDDLRKRGIRKYCLTTDRDNNEVVNKFYLNHGFILARSFCTPEGRWMNEYVMNLSDNEEVA